MKKINLIWMIWVLPFYLSQGQEYVPFPTENATWNICLLDGCSYPSTDTIQRRYGLHGDTTINNINYNRLCIERGDTANPEIEPIGGLREKNKKIYYYGKDFLGTPLNEEILLYDFTKEIGDTIFHDSFFGFISVVLAIDSVNINGNFRRRYKVNNHWYYHNPDYIIEGIGSVLNGLLGNVTGILECGPHYWEHICFRQNGRVIYLNPAYDQCFPENLMMGVRNISNDPNLQLYPNPVAGELNIHNNSDQEVLYVKIIDINGRTVLVKEIDKEYNKIDLPISTGIYHAAVTDKKGKILLTQKIIKL
jgi:hypothetical protein